MPYIADPQDFDIEVDTSIVPRIRIDIAIPEELTHITLRIGVEYGDSTLWGIDTSAYVITPTGLIARQREHETLLIQALTPLFETGRFITADTTRMEIDEGIDLFFEGIDRLEATGNYHITYLQEAHRVSQANIGVKVSVSSGIDWFDTEVALEIDAIQADIGEQLLEAAKHHRRYITLDDGTILMLRDHIRASLSALDALGINVGKSGTQKIGRYMIGALDPGKDTTLSFILDREAIRLRKSLMHFKSLPKVPIPTTLQATLREYQEIGYSWIHFLESERFSGILADDMGLGKTIQTITFLIEFFARNTEQQPVLIICPTSLLFNWRSEFERFAPHIRTMSVTSGKWDGTLSDAQVIITSYGIIQRSVDIFTTLTWSALILDEAQNIKNAHSVRAKNIRLLSARFRLALSGTPIENHLFELKSLFDVLMPGFLGSDADFKRRYMGGDRNELMLLSKKIKPFILRRTKEVVAKDLPPKVEEIISLDMDEDQARYYDSIKSAYQKKVMRQVADEGIAKAQFMVLEALMRMRQACLSPALIDPKR